MCACVCVCVCWGRCIACVCMCVCTPVSLSSGEPPDVQTGPLAAGLWTQALTPGLLHPSDTATWSPKTRLELQQVEQRPHCLSLRRVLSFHGEFPSSASSSDPHTTQCTVGSQASLRDPQGRVTGGGKDTLCDPDRMSHFYYAYPRATWNRDGGQESTLRAASLEA